MIHEHDNIVLESDLPATGLVAGDIGVVIHVHQEGKAFEVEFLALDGTTVAIETLESHQVRPIRAKEIPHVREVAA